MHAIGQAAPPPLPQPLHRRNKGHAPPEAVPHGTASCGAHTHRSRSSASRRARSAAARRSASSRSACRRRASTSSRRRRSASSSRLVLRLRSPSWRRLCVSAVDVDKWAAACVCQHSCGTGHTAPGPRRAPSGALCTCSVPGTLLLARLSSAGTSRRPAHVDCCAHTHKHRGSQSHPV